jgi:hypothetical protein
MLVKVKGGQEVIHSSDHSLFHPWDLFPVDSFFDIAQPTIKSHGFRELSDLPEAEITRLQPLQTPDPKD